MSVIGSNILAGASGQGGGYNLTKSLRFRSSATAYLNRTGSTATNAKLATYSFWFKRGALTTGQWIFTGGAGSAVTLIGFNGSSDALSVLLTDVSGEGNITTALFRDPSAWYHFVIAIDTSQATTADRAKIYVNGVLQAVTVANGGIGLNANWGFNTANTLNIGRYTGGSSYTDGYLAEVNFIDGQALTPSSFGETSTTTGVWIPKKYTGTYGTNGFYLPFTNTTSTSTLGNDFSGNSNTWTVNNISLTSNSTYDSMNDVPTLTSATTANYCVLSPIASSPLISLTNGNLTAGGTDEASLIGTIGVNSGKWYWEVTVTSGSVTPYLGVSSNPYDKSGVGSNYLLAGISWYGNGLRKFYTATSGTSATSNTTGVYGFALDIGAGTLAYYFNNSLVVTDTTIPTSGVTLFPFVVHTNSGSNSWNPANFNFGQQPFAHTPPTGFVALNTFNLPTPTIGATASSQANDYFDATLYTGNGSAATDVQTITNSGSFQPDLVWTKSRSNAVSHHIGDSVRGIDKTLFSNSTSAEGTYTYDIHAFNSNGFTVGNDGTQNTSGYTYVAWQWRASNATAVTNTAGSITSTVSANTTAGFSIVTYTGTGGTGTTTVGHGLNVSPSMVIIKRRNSTADWATYHTGLTSTSYYLFLNSTAGQANYGSTFISPSSSTLTIDAGSSLLNTSTGTYVAYCFAQVAGYSAFGSYTGNGSSDGTFVFTGFRPAFIMIKRTDSTADWIIWDKSRPNYNTTYILYPSGSYAEDTSGSIGDILSNGFKARSTALTSNASGSTYIYMAFAEVPLKFSNAR